MTKKELIEYLSNFDDSAQIGVEVEIFNHPYIVPLLRVEETLKTDYLNNTPTIVLTAYRERKD